MFSPQEMLGSPIVNDNLCFRITFRQEAEKLIEPVKAFIRYIGSEQRESHALLICHCKGAINNLL
jgi:hypothetical protein